MTNEERALHNLVYQLESSWNAGDGDAFASLFADDADVIHILGGYYTGRETIRAGHRMIFGTIYKGSNDALPRGEDQVPAAGYRDRFSAAAFGVGRRRAGG